MRSKELRWLVFVLLLQTIGTCIFLSGFLLKRTVLPDVSQCRNGSESTGCLLPKRHSRAILLIIDALRFDFVVNDPHLDAQDILPYKNKLPIVEETVISHPGNARLYKFIADPPTTTMQRLKGLTTGSLPTFVDAGSNFASSSITEDNWLSQASRLGKRLFFMGDDTWMQLFPDAFAKSWPFPSLNVKDLHTVDNGVLEHLVPQMKSGNWDILIGHFLGVDHCGHRFGPYHPAIGDKLQQMDAMIRSVMAALPNDTVLMVFGDHGMTRSGDHGGDSADEVSSALFVYSPTPLGPGLAAPSDQQYRTVSQVDLVPSLSLLLGLPIPFSNLGQVIPDLFGHRTPAPGSRDHHSGPGALLPASPSEDEMIVALLENAKQVDEYLRTYSATSSDLPKHELDQLTEYFRAANKKFGLLSSSEDIASERSNLVSSLNNYLNAAQSLCRQVWAKFDVPVMLVGLAHLVVSASITLFVAVECQLSAVGGSDGNVPALLSFRRLLSKRFAVTFLVTSVLACSLRVHLGDLAALSFVLALVLGVSAGCAAVLLTCSSGAASRCGPSALPSACAALCLAAHAAAFMSNSFVVQEDGIVLVFGQTLLVVAWCSGLCGGGRGRATENTITLAPLAFSMVTCRVAVLFRGCREEQAWCQPSSFLLHYSTTFSHLGFGVAAVRLLSACAAVLLVPIVVLLVFVRRMNRSDRTLLGVLLCAAAAVCGHFCLQSLPLAILDSLYRWQHVVFPRLAFGLVLAALLYMWRERYLTSAARMTVGLYAVLAALWLLLTMVLGDGLVFASCAMLVEVVAAGHLLSFCSSVGPWVKAVAWAALSGHFFFATGHQCDLPSIRFDAAFVGLDGDQQAFLAAGALVTLNMFASQVLFVVGLPLASRTRVDQRATNEPRSAELRCGVVTKEATAIVFYYVFYHHVMLIAAAIAATVLRRHLMVWKIFAPRLLYAAASAELVCTVGIVILCLLPQSLPSHAPASSKHCDEALHGM